MPDLSFIERIRETEAEQRLRLEKARRHADDMKAAAREEAADIVAGARQEAEQLSRGILSVAEAEYQDLLKTAEGFLVSPTLSQSDVENGGRAMAERIVDFLGSR